MQLNGLRSYIKEDEFRINILINKINIVNYDSMGHFDNNKVIVRYKDKNIIIKGKNLVVSKLKKDEVLIDGVIDNLEFR